MKKSTIHALEKALSTRDTKVIRALLSKEDFHSIAAGINAMNNHAVILFTSMSSELQAKVAIGLSVRTKRLLIPKLTDKTIIAFLNLSDEDDAADILQFLPESRHKTILDEIQEEKRKHIEKLIKYHPETAGGLMDMNFILVKKDFNMKDVAEKIERYTKREKQTPLIVATRDDGTISGYVPYRTLILTRPDSLIKDLVQLFPLISATTSKRKLLQLIARKDVEVIGVIDGENQLVGIIYSNDLVRLIQAESTDNLFQFAGVSREEDMLDPASVAVKRRYGWLIINLATAFLAAFVVSLFEDTIAQMAVLAAFMPIVAGMGGNAGTQALAVVVRGIALGELEWVEGKKVIAKEVLAGLMNGLIVAAVTVPFSMLFTDNIMLSVILGVAMVVNLVVAGFFGAAIPLALRLVNVDPAVASSVFVTTATDIFGFFAFLGLATLILL